MYFLLRTTNILLVFLLFFETLHAQDGFGFVQSKDKKGFAFVINPDKASITWNGQFLNQLAEGKGVLKYYYKDTLSVTYTCTMKNGKMIGECIVDYNDGTKLIAQIFNGIPNGIGTYYDKKDSVTGYVDYLKYKYFDTLHTYKDGDKYYGYWINGLKEKEGIYYYQSGDKYNGQWKNDDFDGQGTYTFADGRKYVGQWRNGKQEGQGIFTWPDGDKYNGQWKNGLKDGQGTYTFADGKKYVGQWKNGLKDGQGIFTWPDGDKYNGQWKNDLKDGQGTYTWTDGRKYIGQWKNGNQEGQGTFSWAYRYKYSGEWKNGLREGQGTNTWANGDSYSGEWKNDQQEGQGTSYYQNGNYFKGTYKNDKFYTGFFYSKNQIQPEEYINGYSKDEYIKKQQTDINYYSFSYEKEEWAENTNGIYSNKLIIYKNGSKYTSYYVSYYYHANGTGGIDFTIGTSFRGLYKSNGDINTQMRDYIKEYIRSKIDPKAKFK